jgi:hypothetical protein
MGVCKSSNIKMNQMKTNRDVPYEHSKDSTHVESKLDCQGSKATISSIATKKFENSPQNEKRDKKDRKSQTEHVKSKVRSDKSLPRVFSGQHQPKNIDVNKYIEMIENIERQKKKKKTV